MNQSLSVLKAEGTDSEMLDRLRSETFEYFRREVNARNGLIADKTQPGSPSSIAAVGMGLSVYIVGVERGLLSRAEAIERTLAVLRFFHSSRQGPEPDATGYKGFYYHFLDMQTGSRALQCELSTVDTAILMAGVLTAACYFTGSSPKESAIRELAESLYGRVDWQWALNGAATITHGWTPESGFLGCRWNAGYSEALILYVLAMGSPAASIDPRGYREWTSTFELSKLYDTEYLHAGPLFIHQMSHLWLDFRGIHDDFNRKTGIDYFENSRRATYVQQAYGIDNPRGFAHYHKYGWGLTASDGPGPTVLPVNGMETEFYDYTARGAPFGPDDGTLSPWSVVASLPFAPEITIDTIRHAVERLKMKQHSPYGFDASYNPTFPGKGKKEIADGVTSWVSPWIFGLNQGPIILMIENYQSELIWKAMRQCPYIVQGLRRAGFRDGWLGDDK
jgi:hypothetical protein